MCILKDISVSNNKRSRQRHPKAYYTNNRKKRQKDQEILYTNQTYLGYHDKAFGMSIIQKNLWNEGFDFWRMTCG